MARARLALGVRPAAMVHDLALVYRVDALLAPVGLLAAFGAASQPYAVLLVLPLVALFALFAREREARIDGALELSQAYRGTALLLGDVIEADDQYTGDHTKDVVELTLQVADALRVDDQTRRGAEFGALLHDVGKIHIPNAIINKPGPLDDDEWAVMKTHTVEGQRMLERVGGVLAKVGVVVRASHERWDGGGYPDGLRGEEIPLASRIVSACDAYNAMTTDRSYRRALPISDAIAELERCSGTQFDPQVVLALVRVVVAEAARAPDWQLTLTPPEPARIRSARAPATRPQRPPGERRRGQRREHEQRAQRDPPGPAPADHDRRHQQRRDGERRRLAGGEDALVLAGAALRHQRHGQPPRRRDEQQLAGDVGDPAREQEQRGGLRGRAGGRGEQDARRGQRGAAEERHARCGLRPAAARVHVPAARRSRSRRRRR